MTMLDENGKREVLVFVYGTLKTGGMLNDYLSGRYLDQTNKADFVGDARIMEKDFVMRDLSYYPALQRVQSGSGTFILGELYLTTYKTLHILDRMENYPDYYSRELIDVWVNDNKFKAWVYYIDGEKYSVGTPNKKWITQCPVIDSGEWNSVDNEAVAYYGPPARIEEIEENMKPPIDDWNDGSIDFEVEEGVFISNEFGEYWGPFDSIEDAVTGCVDINAEGFNCLSIGFRMIRKDISNDTRADIDSSTFPATIPI